jgi:predicted MFS family arabinose efflux permease
LVWGSISVGAALGGIVAREFGLRAPFFFGAALGTVALISLSSSITPTTLANMARARMQSNLDDTPTAIELEPW